MLEEKDLQAIAQLMQGLETRMDQKLEGLETRMDQKLERQKQEILEETTHIMNVIIEAQVKPQFDLLADGQQAIVERLDRMEERLEDMDVMDTRITALEAMVKKLNREMAALRKAQ